MFKFFHILFLTFFSCILYSQKNDSSIQYTTPYEIENPSQTQIWKGYTGYGYYYDIEGKKQKGRIELYPTCWIGEMYSTAFINFQDSSGEWWIVYPENIQSIVVTADSFVVAQGLTYYKTTIDQKDRLIVDYEFLRVVQTGAINLYEIKMCVNLSKIPMTRSFVEKRGLTLKSLLRRRFTSYGEDLPVIDENMVVDLISDDKELFEKWKSSAKSKIRRSYKHIIKEYNLSQK